jgi:hypothetical protein
MKSYWYRIYVGECPLCGRDKGFRERVYGTKPLDIENRYVYLKDVETYDRCEG